jgi:hypothetical protein
MAMMQASQHRQVFIAHPFFAAIVGMAKPGQLRIGSPAVQRVGIDAQAMSSLGERHKDHGTTPARVVGATRTSVSQAHYREKSWAFSLKKRSGS